MAARRKMVDGLLEAVKVAGLKAQGLDLDAFALLRMLAAGDDGSQDSARVFCHLADLTNLAIAVGSTCFFTRPLSAVWDGEDAGSRLADEIRLSIDYYMTQPQGQASRGSRALWSRLGRRPAREPRPPLRAADRGRAAWEHRCLGHHAGRGSTPLHGGGWPVSRGRGVRPVNLIPQERRRRTTSGRRAAPTRCSACSACCSRWRSRTCSPPTP